MTWALPDSPSRRPCLIPMSALSLCPPFLAPRFPPLYPAAPAALCWLIMLLSLQIRAHYVPSSQLKIFVVSQLCLKCSMRGKSCPAEGSFRRRNAGLWIPHVGSPGFLPLGVGAGMGCADPGGAAPPWTVLRRPGSWKSWNLGHCPGVGSQPSVL